MRTVKTGGFVWGVFLDGKLKGFTSVEADLLGGNAGTQTFPVFMYRQTAEEKGWAGCCF